MRKMKYGGAAAIAAVIAFGGPGTPPILTSTAEAAHFVFVPRTTVRVAPRVGPAVRYRGYRSTSTFFWWPWSAPCRKDKRGNCR